MCPRGHIGKLLDSGADVLETDVAKRRAAEPLIDLGGIRHRGVVVGEHEDEVHRGTSSCNDEPSCSSGERPSGKRSLSVPIR